MPCCIDVTARSASAASRSVADGERFVRIDGPYDLRRTLDPLRRGHADPAMRLDLRHAWRATRTPDGPATLAISAVADGLRVLAWGPGAGWALERAPALLGAEDDPSALVARHALIRDLQRRLAGIRIGRTLAVFESLFPAILEQKVTGGVARRGYLGLVGAHGEPAPGPFGLRLPPAPQTLARLPYYVFHPYGIEQRRADTVRRAARTAARLESLIDGPVADAYAAMRSIPGVGTWTAAEVGIRALGDPDAVSVGDFHTKHLVCWALAGEPRGTDERMLELLEPYVGQRGRVIRLLESSGIRPPAYGPRLSPRRIERD
jgi:3-methyladenine DNA glycosylase/8-oxoguanine DNA glycosylase